jgi:hypothetical protein
MVHRAPSSHHSTPSGFPPRPIDGIMRLWEADRASGCTAPISGHRRSAPRMRVRPPTSSPARPGTCGMLGYQGPAQPSPTIGDALNAGADYRARHALQGLLASPRLSLQAQPPSRAAADKDLCQRSAGDLVAGRARLAMCNLYSITTNQVAIAGLFRRMNRYVGAYARHFSRRPCAVVRNAGDVEEMVMMRGGTPPPPRTPAAGPLYGRVSHFLTLCYRELK